MASKKKSTRSAPVKAPSAPKAAPGVDPAAQVKVLGVMLRKAHERIKWLETALTSHAALFPPGKDGKPDVGRLNRNIRATLVKLKIHENRYKGRS